MRRVLKLQTDQKILFCSDLHLGHQREFLFGPRGFSTIEEHDDFIFQSFQDLVDGDTVVFNLGDVCFNDPDGKRFSSLADMPCKKHYVLDGNHNSGMKQCYDISKREMFPHNLDMEFYPLVYRNVTFVGREVTVKVGRQEICLSHFSKLIWDHMSMGAWNLHGHSHGNLKGRNPDAPLQKALDVGVENAIMFNGTPFFTFEEIKDIMETKTIQILDHHTGKETPS